MKKLLTLFLAAVFAVVAVSATDTTLDDDLINMSLIDVATVEYCIFEQGVPVDIEVIVDPICQELDNVTGCSAGDIFNPAGFTVVPVDPTTGADGCVDLTITTNLTDGGKYVYTVGGFNGVAIVGAETGSVNVIPEMGVIATLGVLIAAGLFVYRKRK